LRPATARAASLDGHRLRVASVHRVEAKQVCKVLDVDQVVDGHQLEGRLVGHRLQEGAPDPSQAELFPAEEPQTAAVVEDGAAADETLEAEAAAQEAEEADAESTARLPGLEAETETVGQARVDETTPGEAGGETEEAETPSGRKEDVS